MWYDSLGADRGPDEDYRRTDGYMSGGDSESACNELERCDLTVVDRGSDSDDSDDLDAPNEVVADPSTVDLEKVVDGVVHLFGALL